MKNLLINRALAAKKKKLFTFFLALVASVGTMSAAITVRLDPSSCSGWSTVLLWAWTDESYIFDWWPGQIVSTDDDGWYSYTFDEDITSVSIIWSNGTDQTVDIEGVTSSTCFALNSTTGNIITVSVVNCPANVTPDPDPTPDYECVQIGDLYYNLNATNKTAEVTSQYSSYPYWSDTITITTANIPASVTYNSVKYSVTSIGDHAFRKCYSLTSVTIPNSVTSIGDHAFRKCYSLTSVTIGNSVTSIGDRAFYECTGLTSVTIEAEMPPTLGNSVFTSPNYCPIYVPCGTLDSYKTAAGWSDYASQIKYAPDSSYTINKKAENGNITTSSTDFTICDEPLVECTANPDRGFDFVRWADGNTENPRTIELTQDTTMEAIFDYLLTGKCGKDSALTWTFEPASMALNITGKGALSENYTYGTFIESLTIGNEINTIGERAFYGCSGLKNVILGSSVKVLEQGAFSDCSSIETITCYSQRPPTVNQDALYGLNYSTIVYVPADYLNTYKMHDAWGLYDVRPLGAKNTETADLNVTPAETTADVAWPSVSGAATYELVIKDKSGNVICTLVFNANGQLTQIAFNAPSRNGAPQQTQAAGFSFTVTGLEEGTSYDLTITSKDNNGGTLDTKTVSFTTTGEPQGIEDVPSDQVQSTKFLRDGKMYIIRGEKVYNAQGALVK